MACHIAMLCYVINIVPIAENILNNVVFYAYIIDTPKEGVAQHEKRECLRGAIRY